MIRGAAKNPRTSLTLGIAAFRNKICHERTSLLMFRQQLRDLARLLNEELGDRAEDAVLNGNDHVWHASHWQVDGQDLDLRAHFQQSQ